MWDISIAMDMECVVNTPDSRIGGKTQELSSWQHGCPRLTNMRLWWQSLCPPLCLHLKQNHRLIWKRRASTIRLLLYVIKTNHDASNNQTSPASLQEQLDSVQSPPYIPCTHLSFYRATTAGFLSRFRNFNSRPRPYSLWVQKLPITPRDHFLLGESAYRAGADGYGECFVTYEKCGRALEVWREIGLISWDSPGGWMCDDKVLAWVDSREGWGGFYVSWTAGVCWWEWLFKSSRSYRRFDLGEMVVVGGLGEMDCLGQEWGSL